MRRVLFGLFWFGLIWMAILVAGGAIAGGMAGTRSGRPGENAQQLTQRGYDAGVLAGAEFGQRHGPDVLVAAAALAALGTIFGWLPGTRPRR